jgi:hypothetical protein
MLALDSTVIAEGATGPKALLGQGDLHDDVFVDFSELLALRHHPLRIHRHDLCGHRTIHGFTDLEKNFPRGSRSSDLGEERGVGRDSVDEAGRGGPADFGDIGRVEKYLHRGGSSLGEGSRSGSSPNRSAG